jgi:L-rhamnose isomerase
VDRLTPRALLRESLDAILADELDPRHNLDAVESKLFGLASESYVVGSHEFFLGYAAARGASDLSDVLLCLDSGHFHPTEVISDKLSSVFLFVDEVLLHVSRGVRWDSDHVVTLTEELQAIMQELVRGGFLDRVHIGLDFFDASINRVAAWVIGTRNALRALLMALLEPIDHMRELEVSGDYGGRLALLEELKGMPFGAIWDYHCLRQGVPVGFSFVDAIRAYEEHELSKRA